VLSADSETAVTIPPAILDAIGREPGVERHWFALAAHLHDEGHDDLAAVVRGFWPAMRDNLAAGDSLESTLAIAPRDMARLAKLARAAGKGTPRSSNDGE
jgi:hypothetical protein